VREFSWAIPTPDAVEAIAKLAPVVEIGAGTGYWAALVAGAGGDIVAYDTHPFGTKTDKDGNHYRHDEFLPWFPVQVGGVEALRRPGNRQTRTLFLCWPPLSKPMAAQCLRAFRGEYVAYIGEGKYGCTADGKFHRILDAKWDLVEQVDLPNWDGLHDGLGIWKRRNT
jgi:hypothetical protein